MLSPISLTFSQAVVKLETNCDLVLPESIVVSSIYEIQIALVSSVCTVMGGV